MTDYEYFQYLKTQAKDPAMTAFYDNLLVHMQEHTRIQFIQRLESLLEPVTTAQCIEKDTSVIPQRHLYDDSE